MKYRHTAWQITRESTTQTRIVTEAESRAALALVELRAAGPDDILTPWHVAQLADVERLVRGIEAASAAFPPDKWADWREVLREWAVLIEQDAQRRRPERNRLQDGVLGVLAALREPAGG